MREDNLRNRYKMRCPQCGYSYGYIGQNYEWEHCPICGYAGPFQDFIIEVKDDN